jgi:hypothetical protein
MYNKKQGYIDKDHIKNLFSKKNIGTDVFYIEEFCNKKIYNENYDTNFFHDGNFNIKGFVKPYTEQSEDYPAEHLLKEWYDKKNSPLLVMKGTGGIGKTTVARQFLDDLLKENKKSIKKDPKKNQKLNILFINSQDIINDIMKNPKIEDIFDFYKVAADKYQETQKKFDRKSLELSVDNGDLLIALDGIDEVITKIGNKLNIQALVESIFKSYSGNLKKSKILITCRDYFWDKNKIDYKIETLALKPFNRALAKNYFDINLTEQGKIRKALELADSFSTKDGFYIPYILDMIKDDLLSNGSTRAFDSSYLEPDLYINDHLIAKACERETIKLLKIINPKFDEELSNEIENPDQILNIDDQIIFFTKIYHRQLKIRFSYFSDSKIIGHQTA